MYYDSIEAAIEAAPHCTHVLTTGPKWFGPQQCVGEFQPAVCQDGTFYNAVDPVKYGPPCFGEDSWVIALDRTIDLAKQHTDQQLASARFDPVTNPKHYQLLEGVQVYDVRHAILAKNPTLHPSVADDWSRSWEYLTRMFEKNGLEDAKKARWYLGKLIARLEQPTK
ncbi:protein of unknown function DUF3310 [Vibrio phage 13VV501A]|nr:protein of unknown function DUF3310 [Vibrio phage 13VV501A]